MSEREQFETAYRQEFGKRWVCPQRQDMFKRETNRYAHLSVQDMWVMWQAARAQPAQAGQVLTDEVIRDLWSWSATAEAECTATTQQHAFARAIEQAVLAKRVPMTEAEMLAAFAVAHPQDHADMQDGSPANAVERIGARNVYRRFERGIRAAERHHGIVGEKGGA